MATTKTARPAKEPGSAQEPGSTPEPPTTRKPRSARARVAREPGLSQGPKLLKKTIRERLAAMLESPTEDGDREYADAVVAALVREAGKGNVSAFNAIRDILGEKPKDKPGQGGLPGKGRDPSGAGQAEVMGAACPADYLGPTGWPGPAEVMRQLLAQRRGETDGHEHGVSE